jgi:hypothetical protein
VPCTGMRSPDSSTISRDPRSLISTCAPYKPRRSDALGGLRIGGHRRRSRGAALRPRSVRRGRRQCQGGHAVAQPSSGHGGSARDEQRRSPAKLVRRYAGDLWGANPKVDPRNRITPLDDRSRPRRRPTRARPLNPSRTSQYQRCPTCASPLCRRSVEVGRSWKQKGPLRSLEKGL